jgi:hypothetical protein
MTKSQAQNRPTVVNWRSILSATLGVMILASAGCSRQNEGPERVIVRGKVNYNGEPVSDGQIRFIPKAETMTPVSGSAIAEGTYEVTAHGGVPVGTYVVQIEAHKKVPYAPRPGERAPPIMTDRTVEQQYLPSRFNEKSQLVLTIEPGSGTIVKDFDLID